MTPTIAGVLALAIPLLLLGLLFLRRYGIVFLFYVLICAVGIGYLFTTGAVDDIGNRVLAFSNQMLHEKAAEPAPAAPAPATP